MIKTIEKFIEAVRQGSAGWHCQEPKWFRGEPLCDTPLIPSLYRSASRDRENELLQMFRARGAGYSEFAPHRDHTDQWLFLAQHVGLPTRLLDWSEGALIALHFALKKHTSAVVWMLNPLELNALSAGQPKRPDDLPRQFPLPWYGDQNPAFRNLRAAWEESDELGVDLPIAVYPTYVHPRLPGQRACFTVHGKRKEGLGALVSDDRILQCLELDPAYHDTMRRELKLLGVTDSVLFPDLDGLAEELKQRFS
ncbi:FRG domain-containing protein [Bradyrhizobium manausense]|uniref:FRG domain-containing protein n=1 Tax=Bradyrhizobium TaxID=374 RepID=UPI001BA6ACBA|nr:MULTISPECIES: FRG domain-containing protein [Bradyrhizobium]MBR0825972.1 FRG domain-containing protein [Bradyrhizobium manausense]UVO31101.1 FRG domain-containing protein [Bradyrhizobium arachidis]